MIIRPATYDDIPTINEMAQVVFRLTYRNILSPQQMEFMMDWMYSPENLAGQMDGGHRFFVAEDDTGPHGYVSVRPDGYDADGMSVFHLEKIYVMPESQGLGLGKELFETAVAAVRKAVNGAPARIELNVNRNNPAVGFYKKLGLTIIRQGDFPIGHGFFMNDYIMGIII